ncbi:MAG TPA: DUF3592 domain-containing protein [Allosphingosinicella sp.]
MDINSDAFALTAMLVSGLTIAAVFLLAHVKTVRKIGASAVWPRTTAEVIESRTTLWTKRHHRPLIRYRYRAGGDVYVSDQIAATQVYSTSRAAMQAFADRYPLGAQVEIAYDPGDPGHALIEAGRPPKAFLIMAAFGAAVAAASGSALLAG